MNSGNNLVLSNGLRLSVDYIAFTLQEPCFVSDAIELMGYTDSNFRLLPTGKNGYRSQMSNTINDISIQFDGNKGMGIHVDVPGASIPDMLLHFYRSRLSETPFGSTGFEVDSFNDTVLREFFKAIQDAGHITRLDIAIDDIGSRFYTLEDVHNIFSSGQYVSKFKSWQEIVDNKTDRTIEGRTIYLGKRVSEIMFRIYDKQLEQNKGLIASGQKPLDFPWVRWELEMKKKRALRAVENIVSGMSISDVAVGVLSNYLRIINIDNSRKCRCSTSEKWEVFISGITRLSLYRPDEPRKIDKMKRWLKRFVAPTLVTVIEAEGGSTEIVDDMLSSGSSRRNARQKDIIDREMGYQDDFTTSFV